MVMFSLKLRPVLPSMTPCSRLSQSSCRKKSDDETGNRNRRRTGAIDSLLEDSASFHEYKSSKENPGAFSPYPREAVKQAKKRDQASYAVRPPVDPSHTSIFLFPGQGTQFVGMGRKLMHLPQVKEMFLAANEILKYDLMNLCIDGPKRDLDMTVHAQPAIYVSSLAAVEAVRETEPQSVESCVATAGFSLGEITALTFAGALSFEEGLKLVQIRAEAMQYASDLVPSGMMTVFYGADSKLGYAVNLAKDWCVRKGIQKPECCVSNYLYPGCKIVAGNEEALQFIEKNAADFKLRKLKRLPVSGAFHTKLMNEAVAPFREALKRASVQDPLIPVHSNVDGKMYKNAQHIKRQLPEQILAPVKWEQTLHILYERPADTKYPVTFECGPGNSLKSVLNMVNRRAGQNCKVIDV